MNKLIVEIKTETKETKVINLPTWTKGGNYHYAVLNNKDCIRVHNSSWAGVEIGISTPACAFNAGEVECTEVEFQIAYKAAFEKIQGLLFESEQTALANEAYQRGIDRLQC